MSAVSSDGPRRGGPFMAGALVGRKCGMTRLFTPDGRSIPVTVILVQPNRISQIKTESKDGYSAVQVTTGSRRGSRLNRAQIGHFEQAGVGAGRGLWEFRVDQSALDEGNPQCGGALDIQPFLPPERTVFGLGEMMAMAGRDKQAKKSKRGGQDQPGKGGGGGASPTGIRVDVTGVSKGKGYAGVVKRWNFRTQDNSHGNSLAHRAPGSIGQCQTPGRVFKGKKMAGHMGASRVTTHNLEVVQAEFFRAKKSGNAGDDETVALLVKGAVPGAKGQDVIIRLAVKSRMGAR